MDNLGTLPAGGAGSTVAAFVQNFTAASYTTKIDVRKDAGGEGYNLGVFKTSGEVVGAFDTNVLALTETVFVVGRYTYGDEATDDTCAMWVNPDPSTFGAAIPPTPSVGDTVGGADFPPIVGFALRAGSGGPNLSYADEVRVGLAWADVTPPLVAAPTLTMVIGRVQSSGNNVAGATVQFDSIGKSSNTDSLGRFAISNVTASSGYLLTVSAAGYAIKRFPNINVLAGTNDLGDLQIGNPVNLPVQLRPLVPDVNKPVSSVEEGGTAYRYYQVVATDGRTLVGGVIVGLRRAGGAVVPQDGDISTEWAGYETGKPDADGLVRLRLPSSVIGSAGSSATFEVLLGAAVVQTFTATVKPREYEQVWKHKWSVELGKKTPVVKVKGQSHETTIIRKFGGSDDGLEIVGRERDEEFKVGVGLDFGARLGRTGSGASVGLDGSLKVGLGQSFRFSPDTTDVLDNLLKLNAAFADNLNLVPLGGIVLEGMREQLEGYILGDQVESTDTSLKLSGHAKGETSEVFRPAFF